MRSWLVCPTAMISRSCAPLVPTPWISRRWPIGLWTVASRRSLWHPRASLGFRCVRNGKRAASCRPAADLVALRTLLRHRAQLLEHRAPHVLHMQQALLQMHSQLSHALRDITGATGPRLIRAMVAGARAPQHWAALRNDRCKKDAHEIAMALTGTWREEHLFVLTQALALFDFSTTQLSACDAQVKHR